MRRTTVAAVEALGGTAVALPLDTGRLETFPDFVAQVDRALSDTWRTGTLTGLVNNAGLSRSAPVTETTEAVFDELLDALFKGPYFLTQALLPRLADGGAIVNVGSTSAHPGGISSGYSVYGAAKGAVEVWTRYLAKELGPRGIRVNSVAPGPTRTRLGDDGFDRYPELVAPLAASTALGRIGEGADVGRVIAFLLSEGGSWITGEDVTASGGFGL
ncbi:SDR family NAD(P)-dependent oxidoreductase [Modestobacter versicolor]|uniref:SDR family NAD(P)-dependent oxidoreductase n=1 Tax=Modestobacter versicolor TaxID=429133 RepID=UPI0034DF45D4